MTEADLSDIATLQIGGSPGPAAWIEWTQRNYDAHGFGLTRCVLREREQRLTAAIDLATVPDGKNQ